MVKINLLENIRFEFLKHFDSIPNQRWLPGQNIGDDLEKVHPDTRYQ